MKQKYSYDFFLDQIEEIEEQIGQYEEEAFECEKLRSEIENIENLEDGLRAKYEKKYGIITTAESGSYSMQELIAIREELADTSLLTLIKRFFGIGGRRDEIYRELMSKIQGVLLYLNEELNQHTEKAETAQKAMRWSAEQYETSYREVQKNSGCTPDTNWWEYEPVSEVIGELYLCDVDIQLEAEVHYADRELTKAMPGAYRNGSICIPYTHSLEEPVHFLYEYKKDCQTEAIQAVKSLVYQMIRMTPAYHLQFHLMDGENTGSDFGELIELQKVREADVLALNRRATGGNFKLAQLYLSDADISNALRMLDQYMTTAAEEIGAYGSLKDYNEANSQSDGKGKIPQQIVIIENFPTGFSDEDIRILDKLIRNGQNRGISILLLNNQDRWQEMSERNSYGNRENYSLQSKVSSEALLALETIRLEGGTATIAASDCSSTCTLQTMRTGKNDYVKSVIQKKMSIQVNDNYFPNVFDIDAGMGKRDATKSLRIPFALDRKGNVMEYCLGEAMNAHGLISGGTGSGKSTLLHMLISSIVLNYSPEDVEIWLADYKITEFYSYKTNTPPHIRFIGLSKTEDFSYAFIDKITEEMARRQNLIAMADYQLKQKGEQTNVTNFKEYREAFGTTSMRRLVVMIDEFHVMAQHAQLESEYKQKLENLLAEARALGISLLFSDQAIVDGLRGLSDKGKKQIKARIAMANYEDELKETLNEREREKIKPFLNMKVGEIAVQTVSEERDEDGALVELTHIERGQVVYIDGGWRYKVNEKARIYYGAQEYVPDYFDDREIEKADWNRIAKWEDAFLPAHRNGEKDLQMYLGRPVNLAFSMHFGLLPRKGNNIMSVAGTEEQQMRIVQAAVWSFARQADYEITVFADPFAGVYREFQPEFRQMEREDTRIHVYDDPEEICREINVILGEMKDRKNRRKRLVLWLGLDALADVLQEESDKKPEILKKLAGNEVGDKKNQEKKVQTSQNGKKEKSDLDNAFFLLFGDPEEAAEKEEAEEEPELLEMEEESFLYNASEDIEKIVHLGPARNVYNFVVYDTALALRDFRGVKATDFNHKIAFVMSDNEALEFLERSSMIRSMPENMAFYYNGRNGQKFVPYQL